MTDSPTSSGSLRLRLVLGKFRVTSVSKALIGYVAKIQLGPASMEITIPYDSADIRSGDLITLYTEVPSNAPTLPTPVQ